MEINDSVELKPYNTFGIAAKARQMAHCHTSHDVCEALRSIAQDNNTWAAEGTIPADKLLILGGGSNMLLLGDFDGLVLRPLMKGIDVVADDADSVSVRVGAGETWDDFVAWSVEHGLHGAENLSGIPGNVGASPVQNIGAYGAEAKDVIESVEGVMIADALAGLHTTFRLTGPECAFGYRDSIFKHALRGKAVICHVVFRLQKEADFNLGYGALRTAVEALGGPSLANIRKAVIATRDSKLPDPRRQGNAGSFFKNPEVPASVADDIKQRWPEAPVYDLPNGQKKLAAGWLIEQSGWKGRALGPAAVHDRQALVLVNNGGATGEDIVALCCAVQQSVKEKFGIELHPEVNFIG